MNIHDLIQKNLDLADASLREADILLSRAKEYNGVANNLVIMEKERLDEEEFMLDKAALAENIN